TVSPEVGGRRTFAANVAGRPLNMALRATELGPHGLPALMSKSGQVIEVQREKPGVAAPAMVRLPTGEMIRIDKARTVKGELQLFDVTGKQVQPNRLQLPLIKRQKVMLAPDKLVTMVPQEAFNAAISARKFKVSGIPVFVDAKGNVIDVEEGQADGGVLISQNGTLIYYITVVNDVYAYHRTMQGAGVIPANTNLTFPLTMTDANAVKTFAATKGHNIIEPEALAIESKSSWVEASAVANPADYVQVSATVTSFDKTDPNMWVPGVKKTVKLVMVGIHVVGSTQGHGEMVWGTFEHTGNAPNDVYVYTSTSGQKTIARNTVGSWLFTPSGSAGPFNAMSASWSPPNIIGTPVGPANVLRAKPWGSRDNGIPSSVAGMNTQVISANSSVISQLVPGDVRAKYFQLGTTWTIGGAAPNGGNEVGTNDLANATIETFMQGTSSSDAGSNCFSCHGTNKVAVSHIYRELKPLP
ncbi:MAG: hypothetical protein RL367_1302, partial [Pseudomonadota bacterium]